MTRTARLDKKQKQTSERATPWRQLSKAHKHTERMGSVPQQSCQSTADDSSKILKNSPKSLCRTPYIDKSKKGTLQQNAVAPMHTGNFGMKGNRPQKNKHSQSLHAEYLQEFRRRDARRECRRQKRQQDREDIRVCFNCRNPGHMVADCPETRNDINSGAGICFRCGSTEHSVSACPVKVDKNQAYPYAKCFICGDMGHLSKQCPDNPRGLYPIGGGCNQCGSVEHFMRDCPEVMEKRLANNESIRAHTISIHSSVDDDPDIQMPKIIPHKKPKVVKF